MKNDNRGLSLVELLAAIAILAVATTAIMAFMNSATRNYSRGNAEATIQREAQVAMNQIIEILIDAQKGVTYTVDTTDVLKDADATAEPDTISDKYLTVYNDTGFIRLHWSKADSRIYYAEYSSDGTQTLSDVRFSDYVKDFSVDLTNADNGGKVRIRLDYKSESEGKTYTVNQYITLRNAIYTIDFKINQARDVVYAASGD